EGSFGEDYARVFSSPFLLAGEGWMGPIALQQHNSPLFLFYNSLRSSRHSRNLSHCSRQHSELQLTELRRFALHTWMDDLIWMPGWSMQQPPVWRPCTVQEARHQPILQRESRRRSSGEEMFRRSSRPCTDA